MFFKRKHKKNRKAEDSAPETVIFEDEPMPAGQAALLDDDSPLAQAADDSAESEPSDSQDGEDAEEAVLEDEVVELEFDEDDIQCYLVDENDVEVGFVLLDEAGNEVEYYYADEDEPCEDSAEGSSSQRATATEQNTSMAYKAGAAAATAAHAGKAAATAGVKKAKQGVEKARSWVDKFDPNDDGEYDLGITREGVKETTQDMNAVYRESVETISELKDAFDDIKEGLNLDGLLGTKKRRR